MNPELTFTLPAWQTACGITDMMMHTMERYFSKDDDMETTDAIAEAILRTCMKEGPLALTNPTDYTCRANIMWAGTLAHNDLTGCGTTGDWATHNIEHELSGLFDVSHGAGLAAVWGSWARYTRNENLPRFARFAHNTVQRGAVGEIFARGKRFIKHARLKYHADFAFYRIVFVEIAPVHGYFAAVLFQ